MYGSSKIVAWRVYNSRPKRRWGQEAREKVIKTSLDINFVHYAATRKSYMQLANDKTFDIEFCDVISYVICIAINSILLRYALKR